MAKFVHVAAAVIVDNGGDILIAQRPTDKHQGGLWEFPGGKVEQGEPVEAALGRELDEELGIQVQSCRPLIQIPYHYPDKSVLLDVYVVDAFTGEAYGREGQPVKWVSRNELANYEFPAANKPILTAALLPSKLLITGDESNPQQILAKLEQGLNVQQQAMVMLRLPQLNESQLKTIYPDVKRVCDEAGSALTVNTSVEVANALQVESLHLNSTRLMALDDRSQFTGRLLSASCHSVEQLNKAVSLGLDFVTLSPVQPTLTHPNAEALGWDRFQQLVESVVIPVYALGGVGDTDLENAWCHGGQGIAAIRSWWPELS